MRRLIFSLLVSAAAMAVLFFIMPQPQKGELQFAYPSEEAEAITKHSELWEWQRLHDPLTGLIPQNIRALEAKFIKERFGIVSHKGSYDRIQSGAQWKRRGPWQIGGRTRAFGVDIRNENIMIAGGVSGSIWRTTDGGATWKEALNPGQLYSSACLVQDTRIGHEDTWYIGTGEFRSSVPLRGNGIYKSTDNGKTWDILPLTQVNSKSNQFDNIFDYIWNIALNPKSEGKGELLAACSFGAIMRSSDGGETWKAVLGGFGNAYPIFTDVVVSPTGVYYATMSSNSYQNPSGAANKGVWRSVDGINWKDITPANFPVKYNRVVIGIAPSDENQVYFLAETPESGKVTKNSYGGDLFHSFWKYTYKSGDGTGAGGSWEDRSEGIPKPEKIRWHFNSQASYNLCVTVHPDNPETVFIGATNLYRSTNGFKDESKTTLIGGTCPDETCDYDYRYPNHHSDIHTIFFSKADKKILYSGSDGGVHKTLDAMAPRVEWTSLNNGYVTTQFFALAVNHELEGNERIIGGTQDNGTLFGNLNQSDYRWNEPLRADGFYCQAAGDGETFYASQNSSQQPMIKIWKIKIGPDGKNISTRRIDPIGGADFIWCTPFLLDPNDDNIMYVAGGKYVWRNSNLSEIPLDGGKDSITLNWKRLENTKLDSLYPGYYTEEEVTAVGISKQPANILFYGTNYGRVFRVKNANTGDPAVEDITYQGFPKMSNVGCIAVDPDNADDFFVVFTNYNVQSIFHTSDGGKNWYSVGGNLEEYTDGNGNGPAVLWLEIMEVQGKKMYFAATSSGVFSTCYLKGVYTPWQPEGADIIGTTFTNMIDSRDKDNYIAIGTHGTGIYDAYYNELPAPPASPVLRFPQDGKKGVLDETKLEWENSKGAVYYRLQLAFDTDFENIMYETFSLTNNYKNVKDLIQGKVKYYWRVAGISAAGEGSFSEAWSFETEIKSPAMVYPAHASTDIPLNITMKWTSVPGAISYKVQVSESIFFKDFIVDEAAVTDTSFVLTNLKPNEKYYIQMSSNSENGTSITSQRFSFTTGTKVDIVESFLSGFRVYPAYPNPAFASLNLSYYTAESGMAEVKIYDSRGRKLMNPPAEFAFAGDNIKSLDVSRLSSGVYYYSISINGRTHTGQFTVK